jgi:DNA-binding GntR family transcriptional regulator
MMPDLSASERAYRRLKCDILRGVLPTGPLDIRVLGDRLRMSVTPVREALARLSAERLVKLAPHHGYAIAALSARRLEHLYELAGLLLDLCIARIGETRRDRPDKEALWGVGYAEDIAALFMDVAVAQPNLELAQQIAALNDRLFLARRCETTIFTGALVEASTLLTAWDRRELGPLQQLSRSYHASRLARADAIARLLADGTEE